MKVILKKKSQINECKIYFKNFLNSNKAENTSKETIQVKKTQKNGALNLSSPLPQSAHTNKMFACQTAQYEAT